MYFNNEGDKPHWGWSWLERWMAARPWENRALKDAHEESPRSKAASHHSSSRGESPTQSQSAAGAAATKSHSEGHASTKQISPITSTLIQLQRQQRQMLQRGGCHELLESHSGTHPVT